MPSKKLSHTLKQKLIENSIKKKLDRIDSQAHNENLSAFPRNSIPEKHYRFDKQPGYIQLETLKKGSEMLGVSNPFFRVHEGIAGPTTYIDGKELINFSSYNYLNLNGHPQVNQAAKDAIDQYGTSVSASRIVSGERPIHHQLERAIADTYDVDDAVVYVSGHATNVSTIGYLFGKKDLIIHDEYIHNSSIIGSELSGAKRLIFSHNKLDALQKVLSEQRHKYEKVLIIVEGLYSMDGDYPDLDQLIKLKNDYQVFLMVDEAHSFGVLGNSGKGLREIFNRKGHEVDIWMGTLSKTLSGMGGYIAGESALVENLKNLSPGFLYSVGISAPIAAAALQSLTIMKREPQRIKSLHRISKYFLEKARSYGLDTGHSIGSAIIPVILGSSLKASKASGYLFDHGFNVQPILYPAVPEKNARLRFFLNSEHTQKQVDDCLKLISQFLP
ncbi:MAG: aminotransferase class I/II-fold pyridoxal phosphate-dependent enzyme [Gammaproteobacteria bacterium]|nr:aminotransferase class I/II-fold pyridoxal phosphate-dependent enzyme [Gammaproteobacteria bacterium]